MRPIKFRFRIEIPTGFYIPDEPAHIESFMYSLDELINTPPLILTHSMTKILGREQYSGFNDKHSIEVYEGDICKLGGSEFTVIYDRASFVLADDETPSKSTAFVDLMPFALRELEVVGDVYSKPELLGKAA